MSIVVDCLSGKVPGRVGYLPSVWRLHFPRLDVDAVGQLGILGTSRFLTVAC